MDLRRELDAFERRQVARVLSEGGSFASIGRDLGLSRQAVHRRYRALAPVQEAPRAPALQTAPEVRQAIRCALEEAAALGAPVLGDEHVLLGLLRAAPPRVLEDAGVTLAKARHRIEAISSSAPFFARRLSAADARAVLAEPAREALRRGSATIQPEHLLLGILRNPASGAVRTLRALGADPDAIRARLDTVAESSVA
jgi:ATP-dependent Clp protease ATP-binding subunit ClpC